MADRRRREGPASEPMPGRAELGALLEQYNERPDRREHALSEIERRFRRTVAVLVLDTCGFSRTVQGQGIVHFLALLERMERLVRPCVEEHGGRILRREADNIFAVFDTADDALAAARGAQRDVRAANEALPKREEVGISVGIGFGDLLLVGADDAWGDEMNLASKLGEDLAECGEILLTRSARGRLTGADGPPLEERTYSVSGIAVPAFLVAG